jgi:capsular exopolysaccharide synthesis family protein
VDLNNAQNNFSLGKLAGKILRKWYWLVLSIGVCLAAAYTVNRYTVPTYKVSASVFVKNKDPFSAQALLLDESGAGPSKNLYNEKYFLKSRTLIEAAMRELNFGVTYLKQTDTIQVELYKRSPIEVLYDTTSKFVPYYETIRCSILSAKKYTLEPKGDWFKPYFEGKQFNFGQSYEVMGFRFTIQLDQPDKTNEDILFYINSLDGLVGEYKEKLTAETDAKEASIIIISTVGRSPSKERDFLNKLMEKFVERDLEEKNQATALTSRFIDNLLASNIDTLNVQKGDITRARTSVGTNNINVKYAELRSQIRELENRRETMQMSIGFANVLLDQLRRNADVSQIAIPAGLGVESPQLSANLTELRTLQEDIVDLPSKNPLRVEKEARMRELEIAIRSNITALRQATNVQLGVINTRIATAEAQLRQVPQQDILLADIEQSFQTNQTMVNYLLQKKAEAGIARTTVTSNYKPVDPARVSASMMDPMKNYTTALLVGLLVPIAFIVLKDSFNNKLVTKRDLQNHSSLPLLGIIGYDGAREKSISYSYKASLTAESFRSVRTNLGYFIDSDENAASDAAKVLLFVSSISREGKTYCSKYLAFVLSLSGKKTLLINADMRKPDRNDDLEAEGFTGLSHYLSGKATIDEIILRTKGDNLFYVKSGEVPPNPSELLIAPRMQHLIDTVKASFDYIIIDTPPIGAFSDSVVLLKYADLSICVVRQNHTTRPLLDNLNELHQNNPHIKMALLFNYVDMKKLDAGYKRSYYNAEYYQAAAKPSWWKRLTA